MGIWNCETVKITYYCTPHEFSMNIPRVQYSAKYGSLQDLFVSLRVVVREFQ